MNVSPPASPLIPRLLPGPSRLAGWPGAGALQPLVLLAAAAGGLTIWHVAALRLAKAFILPSPSAVAASAVTNRDLLLANTGVTLGEVIAGFAAGFVIAAVLGYAMAHSSLLDTLLTPLVVASQAVPIVAVAPLIVYVFGPGPRVNLAAAAVIVFFPMLVTTVAALRSIEPAHHELFRALSASRRQRLLQLEVPAALPLLLAALRLGVTLAVIGAVVGEFMGPERGLGSLIVIARQNYNSALTFAALGSLVGLALSLYGLAAALERLLLSRR